MSIIFRIYIDGPQAGTIQVDGLNLPPYKGDPDKKISNVVFPKGTYAIRWKEPDWHWSENNKKVAALPSDESAAVKQYWADGGNGIFPFPNYTYRAGLLAVPPQKPEFIFPLAGDHSPNMPPTSIADTLVVQVTEPKDVEFLDKAGKVITPKPPKPLDKIAAPKF